jgi:hypothetical protein
VGRSLLPTDEQLLARLRSDPALGDGIESLDYWQSRRRRLAWYNIRARREAKQMAVRWEDRLREAILSPSALPITARLSGGLLLARTQIGRWKRRAVIGASVAVAAALMMVVVPLIAVLLLVLRLA